MAPYCLEGARGSSYKDASEMMFESLRHPDAKIDESKIDAAQDALFTEIWQNQSTYFLTLGRNISAGGSYCPVTRWVNRRSLQSAFLGDVIDSYALALVNDNGAVSRTSALLDTAEAEGTKGKQAAGKEKKMSPKAKEEALAALPPIVFGDRAYRWNEGLELGLQYEKYAKEQAKRGGSKKKQQNTAKSLTQSADTTKKLFKPQRTITPINLAAYAEVLDILPKPLTAIHADELNVSRQFEALLKTARKYGQNVLTTDDPSPYLRVLIRTPMRWGSLTGHGFKDILNYWIPSALMEVHVVNNYRVGLIEDDEGGYLRQRLEKVLQAFLVADSKDFNWPDGLRNVKDLKGVIDPQSTLAKMESIVARYRQRGNDDLKRVLNTLSSSISTTLPPSFTSLPTSVAEHSITTPEMQTAIRAVHAVCQHNLP